MKRFKHMSRTKKFVTAGVTVGLALGLAGAAFAGFTTTGSGTGAASTGTAGSWNVGTVVLAGTTIYPGQGSDAVNSSTVQNPSGHGNQNLTQLKVTISVAEAAGAETAWPSETACTTADYTLTQTGTNWNIPGDGLSATVAALGTGTDIAPDHYYVYNSGDAAGTGNAIPSGLALIMVDTVALQDRCQGATVTLTLTAS